MLTKLLLFFGFAVVDLDLVARSLASDVLRVHDVDVLEQTGAIRELRRRYALTAVETGLPIAAQAKVAGMAWDYVNAARATQSAPNRRGFGFYT